MANHNTSNVTPKVSETSKVIVGQRLKRDSNSDFLQHVRKISHVELLVEPLSSSCQQTHLSHFWALSVLSEIFCAWRNIFGSMLGMTITFSMLLETESRSSYSSLFLYQQNATGMWNNSPQCFTRVQVQLRNSVIKIEILWFRCWRGHLVNQWFFAFSCLRSPIQRVQMQAGHVAGRAKSPCRSVPHMVSVLCASISLGTQPHNH